MIQSSATRTALQLLAAEITRARKANAMTAADLAGRAGISLVTLRRVERGEATVAIGTVFEVAFLLGIDLFGTPADNARRMDRTRDVLTLLPERVRPRLPAIDDDF